ncbi:MAG: response regulator [Armatimonadetes bacterium]|nr:response regulator [Armatimonadota bacterium]
MAKILIADDEQAIARLIQINLRRSGHEFLTASDGREALALIETERPDLVILDVNMPYMDGFAVLQTIRSRPDTCELPVIIFTARAHDMDNFQDMATQKDAYLPKPAGMNELLPLIEKFLSPEEPNASA